MFIIWIVLSLTRVKYTCGYYRSNCSCFFPCTLQRFSKVISSCRFLSCKIVVLLGLLTRWTNTRSDLTLACMEANIKSSVAALIPNTLSYPCYESGNYPKLNMSCYSPFPSNKSYWPISWQPKIKQEITTVNEPLL